MLFRTPGRLACRLHRRQEEPDEHTDDGDHHQQFNQGEAGWPNSFVQTTTPTTRAAMWSTHVKVSVDGPRSGTAFI
jgi:hypothetical protein